MGRGDWATARLSNGASLWVCSAASSERLWSRGLEADKVDRHDSAEGTVMATIVGHLSIAQLQQRVRAASDAVEAKYFQAIRLLAQGRTFVEVADILAFVPPAALPRHSTPSIGSSGPCRFLFQIGYVPAA